MFIALIVFIKSILIFFFFLSMMEFIKKNRCYDVISYSFQLYAKKTLTFKQIFKFLSVILVCYLLQN